MADAAAGQSEKPAGPSFMMFAVVLLLLTLVGAGTGFAVGAMLAPSSTPGAAAVPPPPAAKTAAGEKPADKSKEKAKEKPKAEGHAAPAQGEGAPAEGEAAPPVEEEPPVEVEVPTTLVLMPPIITNLEEPKGAWIRVEGSLLVKTEPVEKPDILAEKTAGNILAYLRTVKLAEIEGASGFLAFRDDLDDLVLTTSNGDVRKFLIKSLVVE